MDYETLDDDIQNFFEHFKQVVGTSTGSIEAYTLLQPSYTALKQCIQNPTAFQDEAN
jgi:hypothetical protein